MAHIRQLKSIAAAMIAVAVLSACDTALQTDIEPGTFPDPLEVSLETDDGRTAVLLRDFRYIDNQGQEWVAPSGMISDGASIPTSLWSLVGGPWSGPHRKAAVVHDFYCMEENLVRPWQDVHNMFYEALITAEVDPVTALAMYMGVYRFGPRWEMVIDQQCADDENCDVTTASVQAQVFSPAREIDDRESLLREATEISQMRLSAQPEARAAAISRLDAVRRDEIEQDLDLGRLELRRIETNTDVLPMRQQRAPLIVRNTETIEDFRARSVLIEPLEPEE